MQDYQSAYAASLADPQAYWSEALTCITWSRTPSRIFDPNLGPYGRWFSDGRLNTAYNCLDRHIDAGRGAQTALIWRSAMTGESEHITYAELRDRTARFAGALRGLGAWTGDRVLIYMPMVPEAVVAMLACARIGAIHTVVFGGFAAAELAKRIEDAKPKIVVSASAGLEPGRVVNYKSLLDEAIASCRHKPSACVILQRPAARATLIPERDYDFAHLEASGSAQEPIVVAATHPLYILYTSGTTGKPKGVVRDNGGHAVALAHSMRMVYGLSPGDVCFTASDIGWVVGHSYIVYGPLLAGCTTILYEGKPVDTPDAGSYWRILSEYSARTLFTAPTAIRAIRSRDPEGKLARQYPLPHLRAVFLAGERCDPTTSRWLTALLDKPVIDHWWQTETGWALTGSFLKWGLFPPKPGSAGRPCPGVSLKVLDAEGSECPRGRTGDLAVALPLPPGAAPTLWRNDRGFRQAYLSQHPGYYTTGDIGHFDEDGDVTILGRSDDVINVAGHRLSTSNIEEVIASHADVVECAVVGAADALKGQIPLGLFVLKRDCQRTSAEIVSELVSLVRIRIGPVASFHHALEVTRLPKTRSGKTLRAVLRRIAVGEPANAPSTIEDPDSLDGVRDVIDAWRARTEYEKRG
jgi:propionyl-CoA synthetase